MASVKALFTTQEYSPDVMKVLRQTYYLLAMAVLATIGGTLAFISYIQNNIATNPGIANLLVMVGGIAFMVLSFVAGWRAYKRDALWWVALLIFSSSMFLAPVTLMYGQQGMDIVYNAATSTIAIFMGLSLYTYISRTNFNFMRGFLLVGLIGLVVTSLLNAFVFQSPVVSGVMAYAGVLVMSGLLLLQTSDILYGYEKNYVRAAVSMYISLINMFISLLRIFAQRR